MQTTTFLVTPTSSREKYIKVADGRGSVLHPGGEPTTLARHPPSRLIIPTMLNQSRLIELRFYVAPNTK